MGLVEDLARGRDDPAFYSWRFCKRKLHDGQAEWIANANASVNVLATGNRWGKTSVVTVGHCHSCTYKTGAEPRYTNDDGTIDLARLAQERYETAHLAPSAELSELVWRDFNSMRRGSPDLDAWVAAAPRSKPPNIEFITGARWRIRTVGDDASGVDGSSFYLISVDEAGWLQHLETMMVNVLRIRVADVRGRIWIVGTMKPGEVSQGFHRYAVRAAAYTGTDLAIEHRAVAKAQQQKHKVDPSIYLYARENGIDLDELLDAIAPKKKGVLDRLREKAA